MTVGSITQALRDALVVSRMSVWELGRRTDMKVQVIESALQDVGQVSVDTLSQVAAGLDLELALRRTEPRRPVGEVLSVVDLAAQRLAPESLVHVPAAPWVLALDLEGTLISNAAAVFARPGLHRFLTCSRPLVSRLVVFTAVPEWRFREIARLLVSEGIVPAWFAAIEYVPSHGDKKDLTFIPQVDPQFALLVDDMQRYVCPTQQSQWIAISAYEPPFDSSDSELDRVLEEIARRTTMPSEQNA